MLLGHHYQASCSASNRVRQPPGEVVVVSSAILVFDNEFGSVCSPRDNVDSPTTRRLDLGFANGGEINTNLCPEGIQLFDK